MNDIVEVFTDGACSGNPGPGGYGAIVRFAGKTEELSGCESLTTNNRMELTAVIRALKAIPASSRIRITTDSNYVVKGMTEWLPGWIARNWINSQKKPVMNRDLWEQLAELARPHEIEWQWTRGHHGHSENERCDKLARDAISDCV